MVEAPELAADLLTLIRQLSQQPDAEYAGRLLAAEVQNRIGADLVTCMLGDGPSRLASGKSADRPQRNADSLVFLDQRSMSGKQLCVDITGPDGERIGSLTAHHTAHSRTFSKEDAALVRRFASAAGPTLTALLELERPGVAPGDFPEASHYLRSALEHHQTGQTELGVIVPDLPTLARGGHWVLLAIAAAAAVYLVTARVDRTIEGPGVIRAVQKTGLSAPASGVVRSVDVVAGQRVGPGELVATLHSRAEQSATDRFNSDIRSPVEGVVSDIRLRVGQRILIGDIVGGVTQPEAGFEVISFLPGVNAPQMSRGMPVSMQLTNYPGAQAVLRIDQVGPDLVNAADALRFAGVEGSPLEIGGPVVIVRSMVAAKTFESEGRTYRYHDGLAATTYLRVGSEYLLFNLFPALNPQKP